MTEQIPAYLLLIAAGIFALGINLVIRMYGKERIQDANLNDTLSESLKTERKNVVDLNAIILEKNREVAGIRKQLESAKNAIDLHAEAMETFKKDVERYELVAQHFNINATPQAFRTEIEFLRKSLMSASSERMVAERQYSEATLALRKLKAHDPEIFDNIVECPFFVGDVVKGELKKGGMAVGTLIAVNKYGIRIKTDAGKTPYLKPESVNIIKANGE